MRTITLSCTVCLKPIQLPAKKAKAWLELVGSPFVCEFCLRQQIKAAVQTSAIAKAQADTNAFLAAHINPSEYEIHRNYNRESRA